MKLLLRATGRRHTVKFRALTVASVLLAGTSIALAHSTRWAWTESKVEQIVIRDATVRLPREAASLQNQLRTSMAYYRTLELGAVSGEGGADAGLYHNLAYRYERALRKVRSGLEIDDIECAGSGPAVRRDHFKHFRCRATSEMLEIPSAVTVASEDGQLPAVIEGPPHKLGPFQAQLGVHVTGKSRIAYRQIG
jgi:hypothetical protein